MKYKSIFIIFTFVNIILAHGVPLWIYLFFKINYYLELELDIIYGLAGFTTQEFFSSMISGLIISIFLYVKPLNNSYTYIKFLILCLLANFFLMIAYILNHPLGLIYLAYFTVVILISSLITNILFKFINKKFEKNK